MNSCAHKNIKSHSHACRDGKGIFGGHWECARPGCEFHNDAWLYDSIVGQCYLERKNCGKTKFIKGNYKGFNLRDWINCGPQGATAKDLAHVFLSL